MSIDSSCPRERSPWRHRENRERPAAAWLRALVFAALACPAVPQLVVSTIAGSTTSTAGYSDGVGTVAKFSSPVHVFVSPDSSTLVISDQNNNLIRSVVISSSTVTVLAGGGGTAGGYADGVGTVAKFNAPRGLVLSSTGSEIYVADFNNHLVRTIVVSTRAVSVLAGGGSAGGTAAGYADGTGTVAMFYCPYMMVPSASGDSLYVGDLVYGLIRAVLISTRAVTVLAGGGSVGGTASGYADGVGTAAKLYGPSGLVLSPDGSTLFFTDDNHLLRALVISSRAVTTLAGGGGGTTAGFADGAGVSSSASERFKAHLARNATQEAVVCVCGCVCKWHVTTCYAETQGSPHLPT
jgi:DNA-binding beta-propeller fold protein YncE